MRDTIHRRTCDSCGKASQHVVPVEPHRASVGGYEYQPFAEWLRLDDKHDFCSRRCLAKWADMKL